MMDLSSVPSNQLVDRLRRLVDHGNALTAELLSHMGEVDARRLYLEAACPSMFRYCTDILHMSEGQCYKRIRAGRLARKFPLVLPMVHSGQLHLCALSLLAPHMTEDNSEELLQQAVHKTKRQVEKLVAQRFPAPPVPDRVRKLPKRNTATDKDRPPVEPLLQRDPAKQQTPAEPATGAVQEAPRSVPAQGEHAGGEATTKRVPAQGHRGGRVAPLSAESYKIQLTAGPTLHHKLRQAQELLGHQVPYGDLATVFERALDALLPQLLKQRFAQVATPRKSTKARGGPAKRSRHIPAEVKRQVAERDEYQCTYTDQTGRRCPERGLVEFHHVEPFGKDGGHEEANVRLLCRAHNAEAARHDYGEQVMERWHHGGDGVSLRAVPGDCEPRGTAPLGSISRGTTDTG